MPPAFLSIRLHNFEPELYFNEVRNVLELLFLLSDTFDDVDLAGMLLVPALAPVLNLLAPFDFLDGVVVAPAVVHVVHGAVLFLLDYWQCL